MTVVLTTVVVVAVVVPGAVVWRWHSGDDGGTGSAR